MEEALKHNKRLVKEVVESEEIEGKAEEAIDNEEDPGKKAGPGSKLIVAEEIALGHVSWKAMRLYLSSVGGPGFWFIFLGMVSLAQIGNSFQSWFLGYWASQYNGKPVEAVSVKFYLATYSLILVLIGTVWVIGMGAFVFGSVKVNFNLVPNEKINPLFSGFQTSP